MKEFFDLFQLMQKHHLASDSSIIGWFLMLPQFDPMIHSTPARVPKPIQHIWIEDDCV